MEHKGESGSAPALLRGLRLLEILNAEGPQKLERLAARSGVPKASALRLLQTLEKAGAVLRDSGKTFRALKRLAENPGNADADWNMCVDRWLEAARAETRMTAECYVVRREGLVLTRQVLPENEVRVVARPGYLRAWKPELDAVACLGYAFAAEAPRGCGGLAAYSSNGSLERLPVKQARQQISAAQEHATASDTAFNTNGVRRHAVALFRGEAFAGVLAVAESYNFHGCANAREIRQHLHQLVNPERPTSSPSSPQI